MNSENEKPNEPTMSHSHEHGHGHGRPCRKRHFLWKAPLILFFIFVKAAVIMVLWNHLIPDLFHGPELIYPQALGLMILAKLLIGHHGGPFGRFGRGFGGGHGGPWGHRGREFWAKMSDEDRQKLREEFHRRHSR